MIAARLPLATQETNLFSQTWDFLTDPENWSGPQGFPARIAEHLGYSALALAISLVIAVPIGLYIGHTRNGENLVTMLAGALRALPTLGLATLFVLLSGLGLMPFVWALVILAAPPLITSTYAGIANVNPALTDASRALGMTEWQVLTKVEIPNGLAVMMGGLRSAVLQIVATTTIVAIINLGGLGRYIFDGIASNDFAMVLAGGVMVSLLAIVLDLVLVAITRFSVSPGLRQTGPKRIRVETKASA